MSAAGGTGSGATTALPADDDAAGMGTQSSAFARGGPYYMCPKQAPGGGDSQYSRNRSRPMYHISNHLLATTVSDSLSLV